MKLQKDLRAFIELLNARGVEYLVVGGHAVAFHGYPRFTGDIDLLVQRSEDNARRIAAVLDDFGFGADSALEEALVQPDKILQLGRPPNRIDLLTSVSGVDYADAAERAITARLDGLEVRFPSLETLLRNKKASGRAKDLADVEELEKLR